MAIGRKRLHCICAAALISSCTHAAAVPTLQAGQKATNDIIATVPFDVMDANATAELKAAGALRVPAIFRFYAGATNAVAIRFFAAFNQARSDFSNALVAAFQEPVIDDITIALPEFSYFVDSFNSGHKAFPVPMDLAGAWARGDPGVEHRDKWLGALLRSEAMPARPDQLPRGFQVRRSVRLVRVWDLDEALSLRDTHRGSRTIPATIVVTISNLRTGFQKGFPEEEQPMAHALSALLQPNCIPDAAVTKQARDLATSQIAAFQHFNAGQIIVPRGATIDVKAKAALDALNDKLKPTLQIAAEQQRTQIEHEQALQEQAQAQLACQQQQQAQLERDSAQSQARQEGLEAAAMRQKAQDAQELARSIRERNDWLVAALVAVSAFAMLTLWGLVRHRRAASISVPAILPAAAPLPAPVPEQLAPFLAQTLKEALVQGLASQRAELLEVQRLAAADIAGLTRRLDQLHAPMQQRLQAYQDRIDELERSLAERTDENRHLLKLKIEMMRRQIEVERGRMSLN